MLLVVEPKSGPIGTTVKISGSAFAPNTNIGKVSINRIPLDLVADVGAGLVIAGEVITDENGAFDVSCVIPKQPGGTLLIEIGGSQTTFEITSRIKSVTPERGSAGTQIKVVGDGFVFPEDISVSFGETESIATGKTTADGSFEITFEADEQKAGTKEILVTGLLSERTAKATFGLTKAEQTIISVADAVDFGVLWVDEPVARKLTIENIGDTQLNVTNIHQSGTDATHADNIAISETAFTVESGARHQITLTLTPSSVYKVSGTLSIESNAADSPTQVAFSGQFRQPSIEKIQPISGSTAGGDYITITGLNFAANATVMIGDKSAIDVTVNSFSEIIVRTPEGLAGTTVDVVVRNPDSQTAILKGGFTYQQEEPSQPDFDLVSTQASYTLKQDEIASGVKVPYVIILTGKNGFAKVVHLVVDDLPKGMEGEFSRQDVTLAEDGTPQMLQLTVTVPANFSAGKYDFKVRGMCEETGTFHPIGLTLIIPTSEKFDTVISLILESNSLKLNGTLRVHGQLQILNGTDERQQLPVKLSYKLLLDGKTDEQLAQANKSTEVAYDYASEFSPEQMGSWEITASFEGDSKLKPSSMTMPFEVIKRDSIISLILPDESKIVGETINIEGQLEPHLAGVTISLLVLSPGKLASDIIDLTTKEQGHFDYHLELDHPGAWEIKAKWKGNEQSNNATSETKVITVIKPIPKYIIVQGGENEDENEDWEVFNGIVMDIYRTLLKRDFSDDDIYFLSPAKSPAEMVDAKTSRENLEYAIATWAKSRVSSIIPLYIYLLSHNIGDEFLLVKESDRKDFLTPDTLHEWLTPLEEETGAEVTITIEACYSGGFIKDKKGKATILPKRGRTIMTSARNDMVARAQKRHSFSYHLFSYIERDFSVKDAFDKTQEIMSKQSPWLDADGDGEHGEEADYAMLENVYIPYQLGTDLPDLPDIYDISDEQILTAGKEEAQIWALVSGAGISGVWALIAPPDALESDKPFESWEELTLPEIELFDHDGDGIYENTYGDFTKPGTYTITVLAENTEGYTGDPVQTTVTVVTKWDLNGDGTVDISDLIIVGKHLGEETSEGDVNDDGKVDISDLALVSSHFRE